MNEQMQHRRTSPEEGIPAKWAPISIVLGGPGSYEEYAEEAVVVGVRPGPMQYFAAFLCGIFALVGLLLAWEGVPWVGVPLALLFATGGVAATRFRQRTEITRGKVRVDVKQMGGSWSRMWELPGDSACRVHSRLDDDNHFRIFRAELLSAEGWIPIAESGDLERVREVARQIAAAAAVECLA